MDKPAELKKLKASSLSPELYAEISEFLSSAKPDFAISGKTSLYVIYACLKAVEKKLPAKRLRKAEKMIRALCAAAEARELRYGRQPAAGAPEKKGRKIFAGPGRLPRAEVSEEARKKFRQLGITDGNAMGRIIGLIGEEEFSRRHAKILEALPERAYKPLFSNMPDFLSGSDFYPALMLLHEKVRAIDGIFGGSKPAELDYEMNPSALFRSFRDVAERAGLDEYIRRKIRRWASERPERAVDPYKKLDLRALRDPKALRQLFERLGYYVTPITADVSACIKRGGSGEAGSILLLHGTTAYEIPALSVLFWQAGISPEALRAAGVSG